MHTINRPGKRNISRMLSLFLAAVMCVGMLPVNAFAAGESIIDESFGDYGEEAYANMNDDGIMLLNNGGGSEHQPVTTTDGKIAARGKASMDYYFVRYSIVRIGVPDVAPTAPGEEDKPTNDGVWTALQAAIKNSADHLPKTNTEVVPGARINFAASFDAFFEMPAHGKLGNLFQDTSCAFSASRYMTNALCYAALSAAGKDAGAYYDYMTANKAGSPSAYTSTSDSTRCLDFLDAGQRGNTSYSDPMLALFSDGSTFQSKPTGPNGVNIMYGDGEVGKRVRAIFSQFGAVMSPALQDQVTDDFLTLVNNGYLPDYEYLRGATRDDVREKVSFYDQLMYAFGGCQTLGSEFCYRFIVEPGTMGTIPTGIGVKYDITLRDLVTLTMKNNYDWTNIASRIAIIGKAVMPTDKELYVAFLSGGDGITEPLYEVADAGTEAGSVIFRPNTVTSDGAAAGKAIINEMKSADHRMKQFGVGIWAGFQFPTGGTPRGPQWPQLTVKKSGGSTMTGYLLFGTYLCDIEVSGFTVRPSNVSADNKVLCEGYYTGFGDMTSPYANTEDGQTRLQLIESRAEGPLVNMGGEPPVRITTYAGDWDDSTMTATFKDIILTNDSWIELGSLFPRDVNGDGSIDDKDMWNGSETLTVTVTETAEVDKTYKATFDYGTGTAFVCGSDDKFVYAGDERTFTTTVHMDNDEIVVDMTNHMYGIMFEKGVGEALLSATDLGIDFSEDTEWPIRAKLYLDGDATKVITDDLHGINIIDAEDVPPVTCGPDGWYSFTISNSDKKVMYWNKALLEANTEGTEVRIKVEEDVTREPCKTLMELSASGADERLWRVGYFFSFNGREIGDNYDESMDDERYRTDITYLFCGTDGDPSTLYNIPRSGETMFYWGRDLPYASGYMEQENGESVYMSYSRIELANSIYTPTPMHFVIDYNLNGRDATTSEPDDDRIIIGPSGSNPVDCGTVNTGDLVDIKLLDNITDDVILASGSWGSVRAVYKGLYDAASGGNQTMDKDGNPVDGRVTEFTWRVPYDVYGNDVEANQLIVLYAQWDIVTDILDTPVPVPGSGDPFWWVYYDYNYDGGGVVSATYGDFVFKVCTGVWITTPDAPPSYYNLDWMPDGLSGGEPTYSVRVKFSTPENPMRRGWTFKGWAEKPDAKTAKYPAGTKVTKPEEGDTFYAVWEAQEITWDANGGKFKSDDAETHKWEAQVVAHEDIPVEAEEPVRTGYVFTGWYMDAECTIAAGQFEEGVDPGRTYYAGWTPERVLVSYYDIRQGTSVVDSQEFYYDDLFKLHQDMNSTDGWTFTGWKINGQGVPADAFLDENFPGMTYHEAQPKDEGEGEDGKTDAGITGAEGYWTVDISASWNEEFIDYVATLVWNDYQNNDGCRPTQVTLGLVSTLTNKKF